MLIGIDASRANAKLKTGVEWYAYHVICALAKLDQTNRYRLYSWEPLRDGLAQLPENFQNVVLPAKRFWTYTALSKELKRQPVDRLFIPSHLVPRVRPVHTTVTIHDLGFRHFRRNYRLYHYLSLHFGTRWSARWAEHIVVPSQAVADDVQQYYHVPNRKLRVIPNGYEPAILKPVSAKRVTAVMKHYHIQDPYLFFIGRLEERKNVARLIEAFYRLRDSGLFGGQLVLAGDPGVGYDTIRDILAKRPEGGVVQTGYLATEAYAALLKGARAFVFPSLFEGFGIPILEAFAAGTPVLTSNRGATAEVAGRAALLVNPESVDDIHQGMERLLADEQFAAELVKRGRERLRHFGWEKTAEQIHQVLAR